MYLHIMYYWQGKFNTENNIVGEIIDIFYELFDENNNEVFNIESDFTKKFISDNQSLVPSIFVFVEDEELENQFKPFILLNEYKYY